MRERDWTVVTRRRCDECGLDAPAIPERRLADAVRAVALRWQMRLASARPAALRSRPRAGAWSALEYAAHTRDVLARFAERVDLTVHAAAPPELGWWDHEATAADEGYNGQDPNAVAHALVANAELLAAILERVPPDGWAKQATRRGTESFTVAGLARFALHEAHHHLADAERAVRAAPGRGRPPAKA